MYRYICIQSSYHIYHTYQAKQMERVSFTVSQAQATPEFFNHRMLDHLTMPSINYDSHNSPNAN